MIWLLFLKVGGVYTGVRFILPWGNLSNSSVPAPDQTSGGETPRGLELKWLHKQGARRGHVSGFPTVSSETLTLVLPRMPSFPSQYPPVTASLSFKAVLPNPSFIHLMRKLKLRAAEACAWEMQPWLSGTHAVFTGSVHAVSSVVSDSSWPYRL